MPAKDFSNWRFENKYKISSTAMHLSRTYPFLNRNIFWFLQCFSMWTIMTICLFLLCNSVISHDIKSGNYADVCKNFAVIIISINSNLKFSLMLYYRDSIANLINIIDRDYDSAKQFEEKEMNIILTYCQRGINVGKFWVIVLTVTVGMFPVKAFCLMAYYRLRGEGKLIPMFELTFPYFIERYKGETWGFCGIFSLCFFFAYFAFIVYIGFEPLIPIFTLHTCGQLDLLSVKIKVAMCGSKSEQEIKEELKNINIKLQELHRFIDAVQNMFMILMEFNMKTTALIMPCTAFQILEDFRERDTVNIEIVTLFIAAFVHFFTPCYYSDTLLETSERFREAIYSCGWENCRYGSVRKTVLLMITRAGKPLCISSIFYVISLNTFSATCRQAYAIFNMMTAAWA